MLTFSSPLTAMGHSVDMVYVMEQSLAVVENLLSLILNLMSASQA